MSRIAYVNGRYLPRARGQSLVEDRGYQFADGVYEVCEVQGRAADRRAPPHGAARPLARANCASRSRWRRPRSRSCCARPCAATACATASSICRSRAASRAAISPFRPATRAPTVVVTARSNDPARLEQLAAEGVAVVTVPDIRWGRVDIKSVALLPNVLAKQAAREQGAREAWLVDAQGRVTEGASSNAWIVSRDGKLITRRLGRDILPGVTRAVVLDVIEAQGLAFEERAFTVAEAYAAREAFITSASQIVLPVVRIDGRPVGNGAPGLIAAALRRDYHRHAEAS